MEDFINRFYNAFRKNGWTITRQNICPCSLPKCVSDRYSSIPAEWVTFVSSFSACVRSDEMAWFLCIEDFSKQGDAIFRWNEFERMSLQVAIEQNDAEWQRSITEFWDNHLPICLSVADGYEYHAIRISDGFIVHGTEPEFEETMDVAPSFVQFIEMVGTGEYIL